jgi:hypothetical protein
LNETEKAFEVTLQGCGGISQVRMGFKENLTIGK